MRQKFFINPWGVDGTVTPAIPDAADPMGYVSYAEGWTFDYQRVLIAGPGGVPPADPLAKSPTWTQFNAVTNDITVNLQQYQLAGNPEFIPASQNGGSAVSYRLGSIVLYSGSGNPPFTPYLSNTDYNTDTPGATSKWTNLLALAQEMPFFNEFVTLSFTCVPETTYTLITTSMTFPPVALTSGFRITANIHCVFNVPTGTASNNYQVILSDGTTSYLGAGWLVQATETGVDFEIESTFIWPIVYEADQTVTFTASVYSSEGGPGSSDPTVIGAKMQILASNA